MEKKKIRVIISGGGTGGHIFPAISIANALRDIDPEMEILFVGAEGRMEMEKVPAAGYKIVGLPIVGLQRKLTFKNLSFLFKLIKSLRLASKIVRDFNPDIVVGVGGYASGPILKVAQRMKIPTLIQEQNSFAGITNKLLAKKANAICVAYDGMEKYFPKQSIIHTGNPVRQGLSDIDTKIDEAREFFGIPSSNKVILVVGGSLGARTINNSILAGVEDIASLPNTTLLWQTGKVNYSYILENMTTKSLDNVKVFDFIHRMDLAYSVANLVVSRAGAGTISELCLVGKPTILVPSPNVAEDHQTKNAKALVNKSAALMITDAEAPKTLVETIINVIDKENMLGSLSANIKSLALPNAANDIAAKAMELIKR
jgi:UDP-N-acetylglucosamine--N-acetylmuramyl-(pentapeptide) pyrophosphoryl-undecaprenol N-acetylglucosamine transferase